MGNNTKDNTIHDNKNIEDLDFSIRTLSILKRVGILTVADLKKFNENDLMQIRNLGRKSLEEIVYKMKELDVELSGCVYCSKEDNNNFKSTSLETENYKICNEINVKISIINKKTNQVTEEKNIKDSAYIKYCPFCGKKLQLGD